MKPAKRTKLFTTSSSCWAERPSQASPRERQLPHEKRPAEIPRSNQFIILFLRSGCFAIDQIAFYTISGVRLFSLVNLIQYPRSFVFQLSFVHHLVVLWFFLLRADVSARNGGWCVKCRPDAFTEVEKFAITFQFLQKIKFKKINFPKFVKRRSSLRWSTIDIFSLLKCTQVHLRKKKNDWTILLQSFVSVCALDDEVDGIDKLQVDGRLYRTRTR